MKSTIQSDALSESSMRPSRGTLVKDYVTLMKPSIVLLLLITTIPAMFLAEGTWPGWQLVIATIFGGIASAGGASSINMAIDGEIDGVMQRTQNRPLPRGTISARTATTLGLSLGGFSTLWMWLMVNPLSAMLSLFAFVFYALIYSVILKRKTVHNTVLGGIAGAMPPLIGWTAVTDQIAIEGLLLFLIVFCWQPPHFWALAIGLSEDYKRANIPMAPNVLGNQYTKNQILLWACLTVASTVAFFFIGSMGLIYILTALLTGLGFLYISLRLLQGDTVRFTRLMFRYSTLYLTALFLSMIVDEIYRL